MLSQCLNSICHNEPGASSFTVKTSSIHCDVVDIVLFLLLFMFYSEKEWRQRDAASRVSLFKQDGFVHSRRAAGTSNWKWLSWISTIEYYLFNFQSHPVKHFTLKRKPKSAALRAELLQKSTDAQNNIKKNPAPTVPLRSRGIPRKMTDTTPLKGIPSQRTLGGFASTLSRPGATPVVNPLTSSPSVGGPGGRPAPRTLAGRKDGGIKLLDITEQPIGFAQAKKRKRQQGTHQFLAMYLLEVLYFLGNFFCKALVVRYWSTDEFIFINGFDIFLNELRFHHRSDVLVWHVLLFFGVGGTQLRWKFTYFNLWIRKTGLMGKKNRLI